MHLKLGMVCVGNKKYICRYIPFNLSNKRLHWAIRKKWTDAWKQEVAGKIMLNRKGEKFPFPKAKVTITLHTIRLMDYDGAYTSVKPVLDGIKDFGVIMDDSPKYIELEVKQNQVAHIKDQFVEIDIINQIAD